MRLLFLICLISFFAYPMHHPQLSLPLPLIKQVIFLVKKIQKHEEERKQVLRKKIKQKARRRKTKQARKKEKVTMLINKLEKQKKIESESDYELSDNESDIVSQEEKLSLFVYQGAYKITTQSPEKFLLPSQDSADIDLQAIAGNKDVVQISVAFNIQRSLSDQEVESRVIGKRKNSKRALQIVDRCLILLGNRKLLLDCQDNTILYNLASKTFFVLLTQNNEEEPKEIACPIENIILQIEGD